MLLTEKFARAEPTAHEQLGTLGGGVLGTARLIFTGPGTAGITGIEKAIDFREQAFGQMTFVDETVGAVATAFVGDRKAIEFGKDDHAQVGTGEADLLGSLQSVHPRHAEIEEHQIRLVDGCKLYSIQAVTGGTYDLKSAGEFKVVTDRPKRCG